MYKSVRRSLISASLCAIAATPAIASAQAVPQTDSVRKDSVQRLESVRVNADAPRARYAPGYTRSALKIPALPRDIPQAMSTVNATLVRDQAMKSIADVVRYMPGVGMGQGEGNRDQPTIRGNSTTADFFVDGVRDDAQYFRDLYNLERVEALKGSNAMTFGRGGGGGVLNRVTKEANGMTSREIAAEAGSFGTRRLTSDLQQRISPVASARLNTVYENSSLFRDFVDVERYGVNPTLALSSPSKATRLAVGYEYFRDRRTADRGIPSFQGKPVDVDPSTFFGNPDQSFARIQVNSANATLSHDAGNFQIRNHTGFTAYDKFYQNIYPSGADGASATLSAYNHAVGRDNIFSQTDVIVSRYTGRVAHDVVAGVEIGRQATTSFRNTGYFGETATSTKVPLSSPVYSAAVTFRQSASDADNDTRVITSSAYVQDQISFSRALKVIAGARYENFALRFNDNRADVTRRRTDGMISPRVGVVIKPSDLGSIYASYSVSYLPGSGDQFGSLTDVTRELEPEQFTNYEIGSKWDVLNRLSLSLSVYQLDRTNTRSVDPADATRIVQTGAQRSRGVEVSATGNITSAWEMAAAAARQSAVIVDATGSSRAGATVPLVPAVSASLWNRVNVTPRIGIAAGVIHQTKIYAAIDNQVTLPAFTRVDGGLFFTFSPVLKAQLNVENIFDERYFAAAHNNSNISPGSPRALTLSLSTRF
ncbi:MAG TPA: TonB-dependent siderophore receptor [Gemmatimonadaceae bacterium]|nr:TonB-dependent siderophore receptor [Gemmatimonadaceae bacterium]